MSKPAAGAIAVMAPKLMNCFVGAIAVVPFYALGRELGGDRAGRLVALAGAFWPSLILWSVLNLKDIMVVVLIATIMFLAIRFARTARIGRPGGTACRVRGDGEHAAVRLLRLRLAGADHASSWSTARPGGEIGRRASALWAAIVVVMLSMNQGTQWLGLRYLTDKRVEALYGSAEFGAGTPSRASSSADASVATRAAGRSRCATSRS